MSETSLKKAYYDRVAILKFLVSQTPLLLFFVFFVLRQRCLAMFAGSVMVSSCKLSGEVADAIWQACKKG